MARRLKGQIGTALSSRESERNYRKHRFTIKNDGSIRVKGMEKILKFVSRTEYLPEEVPQNCKRLLVKDRVKETHKAYLLTINNKNHWLAKSEVKYGFHPTGIMMAVDVPNWLASEHSL